MKVESILSSVVLSILLTCGPAMSLVPAGVFKTGENT